MSGAAHTLDFPFEGPNVAAELRERLAAARADGTPFKVAWATALEQLEWDDVSGAERVTWRRAFEFCRPEFLAAFSGELTPRSAAVAKLAA